MTQFTHKLNVYSSSDQGADDFRIVRIGVIERDQELVTAFIFSPSLPKVLFGFAVANSNQALTFTQTLKHNGQVVPLPVTGFSVPPSSAGKKQLRVGGLAVKAGAQFPVGQYEVEVYSGGQLLQHGIFDIRTPKSGRRLGASPLLISWPARAPSQVDLIIFILTEEEVTLVPDEQDYYDAQELQDSYDELERADDLFAPFPDDVPPCSPSSCR